MSSQNKNNVESNGLTPGSVPGSGSRGQSSGFSEPDVNASRAMKGLEGSQGSPKEQSQNFRRNNPSDNKQEVVSITYEEIGLFPRSFSRVLDRFLKQVFSDVENLVIQEYRFYRYLFLTTFKSLLILFFVPFFVNFLAKNYVVRPLTEYFWNTKQTEIFLNSYQQKRAFAELKDFEEKLYFESLIYPKSPERASSQQDSLGTHQNAPSPQVPSALQDSSPESVLISVPNKESSASGFNMDGTPVQKYTSTDEENKKAVGGSSFTYNGNAEYALDNRPLPKESFTKGAFGSTENTVGLLNEATLVSGKNVNSSENAQALNILSISSNEVSSNTTNKASLVNVSDEKTESLINSYTVKSSLFVYQTREADKNIQQRYQEKTIELAQRYNDQSIEAITNFFADLISLLTLFYLLYALEIQINITKSFLLEVFFGLDDSKKSLLILLVTDLLVGYHSSNLWELFFEFLFNHYGLPESQTGIFLLVATLPVLLDVLFKYLIFRHLNRSSPATVATYHAMIE